MPWLRPHTWGSRRHSAGRTACDWHRTVPGSALGCTGSLSPGTHVSKRNLLAVYL